MRHRGLPSSVGLRGVPLLVTRRRVLVLPHPRGLIRLASLRSARTSSTPPASLQALLVMSQCPLQREQASYWQAQTLHARLARQHSTKSLRARSAPIDAASSTQKCPSGCQRHAAGCLADCEQLQAAAAVWGPTLGSKWPLSFWMTSLL